MATVEAVRKMLRVHADKNRAHISRSFFKTGKGEYGEGDIFLGIIMPEQRAIVRQFRGLVIKEAEKLLHSKIYEERMVALLIMVDQFERAKRDETKRARLYRSYLKNKKY